MHLSGNSPFRKECSPLNKRSLPIIQSRMDIRIQKLNAETLLPRHIKIRNRPIRDLGGEEDCFG
jgi:hypothetical protein